MDIALTAKTLLARLLAALIAWWRRYRHRPAILPAYGVVRQRSFRVWVLMLALMFFCFIYGFIYALVTPYLLVQLAFPLIILAFITIWALPDVGGAPVNWVERFFFALFISTIIWPNYLAITLPGLPWITMVRLTGFPLAFLVLFSVSSSPEFRAALGKPINSIPFLWKMLAAFACVQVFSIALSDQMAISINKLIASQISWTLVFFVSAYVFLRPGRVELWARILWGLAIALCLIGLWESRLGRLPWAGNIPSFLAVDDESVQRTLAGFSRSGSGKYRVLGTYSTALGLSEFLALVTPFLLHFIVSPYRLAVRVLAGLSVPFVLYTIIQTDARLGVVGFFIAILLYPLCIAALRWNRVKSSIFGPAIVLAYPAIFVAGIAASFVIGRLRVMMWGGGAHQASNEGRVEQFEKGVPILLKNPLGYGIGQGAETLGVTNPSGMITIDTYYLLIALEYGVLGFLLYYGFFALATAHAVKHAIRATKEREMTFLIPVSIALISFLIIKSIYAGIDNHPLAFTLAGIAAALVYRSKVANAASA